MSGCLGLGNLHPPSRPGRQGLHAPPSADAEAKKEGDAGDPQVRTDSGVGSSSNAGQIPPKFFSSLVPSVVASVDRGLHPPRLGIISLFRNPGQPMKAVRRWRLRTAQSAF